MSLVKLATRLDGVVDLAQYSKLRAQRHMLVGTELGSSKINDAEKQRARRDQVNRIIQAELRRDKKRLDY
jgi:hypothetical protein